MISYRHLCVPMKLIRQQSSEWQRAIIEQFMRYDRWRRSLTIDLPYFQSTGWQAIADANMADAAERADELLLQITCVKTKHCQEK
jgi:hypothetical protein